jgi:hypothetical protein
VDWDICERKSKEVSSKLLSWTFVILPRFLKKIQSLPKPLNFTGDHLSAWLFLLTRSDKEHVSVTKELVAGSNAIADAFRRISHLTLTEQRQFEAEQDEMRVLLACRERVSKKSFVKGMEKAKKDTAKMMIKENFSIDQIVKISTLPLTFVHELKRKLESCQETGTPKTERAEAAADSDASQGAADSDASEGAADSDVSQGAADSDASEGTTLRWTLRSWRQFCCQDTAK